jgi:ArsR family transcriptional regulator, arsenate/arsenite/antimonite-responsive transcriptional repressor
MRKTITLEVMNRRFVERQKLALDKTYRCPSICLCESLKDMDNKHFQKVARALADPRRFEIFQKIATAGAEGMCCGAVCEEFPVSQATVSHHLKELTEAGLLDSRSEGQFKYWSANTEIMNEYIFELQNRLRLPKAKARK